MHAYTAFAVTSWRSESSNISLVVLDKVKFIISKPLFWSITKSRTDRRFDRQHLRIKSPSRRLKMRYHSEIRGTYSTKCQKLFFFGNGWVPLNTITSILAVWIDYLCFTNDVFLIFLSWFGLVREILFPQRHNYLSLRTIHHSTLLLCAWT